MVTQKDFFKIYKKKLTYILGVVSFFMLLIILKPDMFTSFYTQREYDQVAESVKGQPNSGELLDSFFKAVTDARQHILVSDATRSFLLILVAAALIYTFVRYRYKAEIFVYSLVVLVIIDLFTVDRRYMSSEDFIAKTANAIPFPETQADAFIKQDTSKSYRVLNISANTFNDASTSYYHQSIGGYHGAKLKRYKELIDYNLIKELTTLRTVMQKPDSSTEAIVASQPALNMLNTKYIIYNPDAPPLQNRGALGNAWFVSEVKIVANADSEIAAVYNFNPANTVIIDKRFEDVIKGFNHSSDNAASINLTGYKPDHLTYSSSSSSEQLAVFSEIYYDKGWNAYIDGTKTPYVRADYVLRAMRIPAGNHTVEFKFEPSVINTGEKISLAGSAIILLFAAFASWNEFKKKQAVK